MSQLTLSDKVKFRKNLSDILIYLEFSSSKINRNSNYNKNINNCLSFY